MTNLIYLMNPAGQASKVPKFGLIRPQDLGNRLGAGTQLIYIYRVA